MLRTKVACGGTGAKWARWTRRTGWLLGVWAACARVVTVRAAEPAGEPGAEASGKPAGDDFSITLTPYAWLPGMAGNVGVGPLSASVNESFTDVIDQSDWLIGLFARADVRKGRLGFYADGGYARIGVDDIPTRLGTTVNETFSLGLVDFGLLGRVVDAPVGADRSVGLTLDALAGGRYMHVGNEAQFSGILGTRSANEDWVDPIVGGEAAVDFGRHWRVLLHGDIGGFGVSSDLTWEATAAVAYRFNLGSVPSSVFVGYKAVGEDFTSGSGPREFKWDTTLHGLIVGMSFTF